MYLKLKKCNFYSGHARALSCLADVHARIRDSERTPACASGAPCTLAVAFSADPGSRETYVREVVC